MFTTEGRKMTVLFWSYHLSPPNIQETGYYSTFSGATDFSLIIFQFMRERKRTIIDDKGSSKNTTTLVMLNYVFHFSNQDMASKTRSDLWHAAVSTASGKILVGEVGWEKWFKKNRYSLPVSRVYMHSSSNLCTDSGVLIYSLLNSNLQLASVARYSFFNYY